MTACQDPGDLEDLRGTVKGYERHVLVCCGEEPWPERVEEADGLLGQIARESKEHRTTERWPFKVTAVRTPPSGERYDLLVFPDRVAYRGVDDETWPTIRDGHLRGGEPADVPGVPVDDVSGFHVLVCVHRERDDRCGDCGPLVVEAFEAAASERDLDGGLTVHRSSHVGGHRFAGNVLVYPGGAWYGYVRPDDVGTILDRHVKGEVWEPHLRGRGLRPDGRS